MTTLSNTGQMKFSDIRTRWGTTINGAIRSNVSSNKFSSYYRQAVVSNTNGTYVPKSGGLCDTGSVPTSGAIQFGDFRGTGINGSISSNLATLQGSELGHVHSHGTRSPADKVQNYIVAYAASQNKPSNNTATVGIYNLTSGRRYAYITMTSGDKLGYRRLGYSNTLAASRMYNSGQAETQHDNATLSEAITGVNSIAANNRVGCGRQGAFTYSNALIYGGHPNQGGVTAGALIQKNTEQNSDAGKGNASCYVYDYHFLENLFKDFGITAFWRPTSL